MLTWTKCGILSTWKHMWNRLGYTNWNDADMDKTRNPVNMETHVEQIGIYELEWCWHGQNAESCQHGNTCGTDWDIRTGMMLTWTKCGILSTWKHMWNRLGYTNWNDADMDKMWNPVDMETHVQQIGIYELEWWWHVDKMRNPVDMETHVQQIGIYELEWCWHGQNAESCRHGNNVEQPFFMAILLRSHYMRDMNSFHNEP